MKSMIVLLMMFVAGFVHADTHSLFSAEVVGDELFVTISGDSCNDFTGSLRVDDYCADSRPEKDLVTTCSADLLVTQTTMDCHDDAPVPRVLFINLNETDVAKEAEVLVLRYMNEEVEVRLN